MGTFQYHLEAYVYFCFSSVTVTCNLLLLLFPHFCYCAPTPVTVPQLLLMFPDSYYCAPTPVSVPRLLLLFPDSCYCSPTPVTQLLLLFTKQSCINSREGNWLPVFLSVCLFIYYPSLQSIAQAKLVDPSMAPF